MSGSRSSLRARSRSSSLSSSESEDRTHLRREYTPGRSHSHRLHDHSGYTNIELQDLPSDDERSQRPLSGATVFGDDRVPFHQGGDAASLPAPAPTRPPRSRSSRRPISSVVAGARRTKNSSWETHGGRRRRWNRTPPAGVSPLHLMPGPTVPRPTPDCENQNRDRVAVNAGYARTLSERPFLPSPRTLTIRSSYQGSSACAELIALLVGSILVSHTPIGSSEPQSRSRKSDHALTRESAYHRSRSLSWSIITGPRRLPQIKARATRKMEPNLICHTTSEMARGRQVSACAGSCTPYTPHITLCRLAFFLCTLNTCSIDDDESASRAAFCHEAFREEKTTL